MPQEAFGWTPDSYATDVERSGDGVIYLRPRGELPACPPRLTDSLDYWAKAAPDRTFVARRNAQGAWVRVSYAQMLERVQRLASGLATRDLSADRPVAILSGNSIEHLTLALAAMWIGVPFCPVSPAYSQASSDLQKLRYVLQLLTPGLIAAFDTRAFARCLADVVPHDVDVVGDSPVTGRTILSLEQLEDAPSTRAAAAHDATGPDSIAKFLLTSGSTGRPKAVITTQRMLCSNAMMLRQAMPFIADEPPVLVDWLPWNHTFGGSHNIGIVLFNGGSLYIDDGKPTPGGMRETLLNLREISPTVYFNVPKGFEMLAHELRGDAGLRKNFYAQLQAYFFAGASLSQHTWDALDEVSVLERGYKVPMLSGLGATETGPSVTFTTPAMGRAGVIGLPAAGALVKLAPVGSKLEIRAQGPNVTPGYWRDAELTRAAFDEEGFYRMGDAVRLIDANDPTAGLRFDGRIAEDFKLASGTWVSVGPLRAELLAAFAPYLQDVVIAGLDRDYLSAVLIPDVLACAKALQSSSVPTHAELANNSDLARLLNAKLDEYARTHPASSMCIRRAMLIPSPPSLDHGEITDKGSINQRAVLDHRLDCVTTLYAAELADGVIEVSR